MKRRDFLLTAGAIAGTAGLGAAGLGATGLVSGVGPRKAPMPYDLIVQKARYRFTDQSTLGMVSLLPQAPPPVLVGHQGKPMVLNVRNTLPDYTSMHWHGVRIANAMDGVPYLTQMPIATNETFPYAFTPPDAGTYWYHPHCMTMDQMAHGLTGVLVIKEAKDPGFDADQAINLKDFRLNEEGEFLPSFTGRGAARAGTFGNVVTANWQENPVYDQPAGALLRLRVVNTDTTRIHKLYLTTTDARIIAWDGHPVRDPIALPTALKPVFVGPGQRLDFALRMPDSEGQKIDLMASLPGQPKVMASLRAIGSNLNRNLNALSALSPNPVADPDLSVAQTHEFVFGWSPDSMIANNGVCGSTGYTFWSINRTPWAGDAATGIGPLAQLELGKSYIFRLRNESPHAHPIHLHGLSFLPLRSNKRRLKRNWTDTALLLRGETVDVALVADNPGDWAFHCHVIEHQKTGLAGYLRVS